MKDKQQKGEASQVRRATNQISELYVESNFEFKRAVSNKQHVAEASHDISVTLKMNELKVFSNKRPKRAAGNEQQALRANYPHEQRGGE